MAGLGTQSLYTSCVILLVLLICQANVPTEGKQMKSLKEEKLRASRDQLPSPSQIPSIKRESSVVADYFGEMSQPQSERTGSSPGIGHCFARQKGQKKSLKIETQLGKSTENLPAPVSPNLSSTHSIERKVGDVESLKSLHANCGTN